MQILMLNEQLLEELQQNHSRHQLTTKKHFHQFISSALGKRILAFQGTTNVIEAIADRVNQFRNHKRMWVNCYDSLTLECLMRMENCKLHEMNILKKADSRLTLCKLVVRTQHKGILLCTRGGLGFFNGDNRHFENLAMGLENHIINI